MNVWIASTRSVRCILCSHFPRGTIMEVKAYDKCGNCGCEFAEHDYVKDSIDQYKCPHPHTEGGYGFFHGGDPRNFFPDGECCSPQEIENHKRACELWDEAEARGETPEPEACPAGFMTTTGRQSRTCCGHRTGSAGTPSNGNSSGSRSTRMTQRTTIFG